MTFYNGRGGLNRMRHEVMNFSLSFDVIAMRQITNMHNMFDYTPANSAITLKINNYYVLYSCRPGNKLLDQLESTYAT